MARADRRTPTIGIATLVLVLATAGCGGFDTGLNPRPDVSKQQGPLTVPPSDVLRGIDRNTSPGVYVPSVGHADGTSVRCVPQANGLGSSCRPL